MEVRFNSTKLAKTCNSEKAMNKAYNKDMAKKLMQRLSELKAADTLEHIGKIPAARCHQLRGGGRQLAVDLVQPYRLIFEPNHESIPLKPDGGLDWARVTKILVTAIVDYH